MPVPSKVAHPDRRGLGDYPPSRPTVKSSYSPNINLTDTHRCAPPTPVPADPVFTQANEELWSDCPAPVEQHDLLPTREHPPQKRQQHQHQAPPTHGTSHEELTRLSARPYSTRASDTSDFASTWESSIVPLLTDLLQKHCTADFSIDVHNFPELSSSAVPRVIYITLSGSPVTSDTASLEATIRAELTQAIPERFNPVYLKFRRSAASGPLLQRAHWYGRHNGELDRVCEPKNVAFKPTPEIGMSIGPEQIPDAASLGGFVVVEEQLYAMSALHAFKDAINLHYFQVSHPAKPDFPEPVDHNVRPYSIGSIVLAANSGALRRSLTFQGMDSQEGRVEMDWCLIGPVPNGKNFVPLPSFQMDRCVAVEKTASVEGNTEVYSMARTSGYSLGFTSDVPGMLRINGELRREWTARQYSASNQAKDRRMNAGWQTVKQWVTSGMGVPGDSGAWLMRRSDNAVVGMIWARNRNSGPLERVRLAYFTPMVDVFADIREKKAFRVEVSLPVYSATELEREVQVRGPEEAVEVDVSGGPWNVYDRRAIREHQQIQQGRIQDHFVGSGVPASGVVLDRRPGAEEPLPRDGPPVWRIESSVVATDLATTPPRTECGGSISTLHSRDKLLLGLEPSPVPDRDSSLPELSTSSSVRSGSSMVDEKSETASTGSGVRIVGELEIEEEIIDAEDPIRAKASYPRLRPDQVGLVLG